MNRSILIVICDFLLVSLLAFSNVNINNVADDGAARPMRLNQATNQADGSKDLAAVMKLALEDERRKQEQLMSDLTRTHESLTQQQTLLSERERQAQALQQQLQSRDAQAARLQQEEAALQKQFADAQTNIQTLTQQLQGSSADALISKEKLAAMEAELRKQSEDAAAMKQKMDNLAQSNQIVLGEKQLLASQLQIAEVEKRSAAEQLTVERQEKAQLAEGVKALAVKSGELTKQLEENRPLAANNIFNDFVTNRVQARMSATRSGLLNTSRRKAAQTVLVTDGTNTFALCHVDETPLTLFDPGTDWDTLSGSLEHNGAQVPIRSMSFHDHDPRVVLVPVTEEEARRLDAKVYHVSADPFKFPDAVIVGANEGYYGECKLEVDLSTPGYARLDRNLLKGLFGKFNPSRGDLVFARNGDLAGVMANGTYCLLLRNFDAAATFQFGSDVREQHTGHTLARLYSSIFRMPFKLQ